MAFDAAQLSFSLLENLVEFPDERQKPFRVGFSHDKFA
jgi:hypothetical protein